MQTVARFQVFVVAIALSQHWAIAYCQSDKDELERFEGAWYATTLISDGRAIKIDPGVYQLMVKNGKLRMVVAGVELRGDHDIKINVAKKPSEMDLILKTDAGERRTLAIYEWRGEELHFAFTPDDIRPPDFTGSKKACALIFRKR